jgi:hypothetical protein
MITVTERAKGVLKAILIDRRADPEKRLRLLPSSDGRFILTLDTELSGDQVVGYEGFMVLLIGIEYLTMLDGKTVDVCLSEGGIGLVVE